MPTVKDLNEAISNLEENHRLIIGGHRLEVERIVGQARGRAITADASNCAFRSAEGLLEFSAAVSAVGGILTHNPEVGFQLAIAIGALGLGLEGVRRIAEDCLVRPTLQQIRDFRAGGSSSDESRRTR